MVITLKKHCKKEKINNPKKKGKTRNEKTIRWQEQKGKKNDFLGKKNILVIKNSSRRIIFIFISPKKI